MEFITLDGIIQGPGSPEEDPADGFTLGGWVAPYDDEVSQQVMEKLLPPSDLLMGRTTFDIWENYWPSHAELWPGVNEVTKYVLSTTRTSSDWQNCVFLHDVEELRKLKLSDGGELKIWGSSEVVRLLFQHDWVDELWLNIHPIVLGKGKRLFDENSVPSAFRLVESTVTRTGVIMAHYMREGEVKTGTVGN